ncbi:hypothetical protein ACN082_09745 [Rothia sp. CCM 9417]|uniref:hypothetical protein n=1 Tax=Rothia sp. CCM 9417 TaxID=3402657 RepID=UPI003AD872AC
MLSGKFIGCPGLLVSESGAWVPVIDSGQITDTTTPNTTGFTSALGKRTVFFRGHTPATWEISGTGTWAQAQAIKRLSLMEPQKYYWVSPLGRHTNILPTDRPQYGLPLGVQVVEGFPVETYGPNQWGNNTSASAPIQPGMEVTATAFIAGGRLRIWWKDKQGELIDGPTVSASSELSLVEVEAVAPQEAVEVLMIGLGCQLFASPAVRIGHDRKKLPPGPSGCGWVSLHDVAISHSSLAYAHSRLNISFTLKEVSP